MKNLHTNRKRKSNIFIYVAVASLVIGYITDRILQRSEHQEEVARITKQQLDSQLQLAEQITILKAGISQDNQRRREIVKIERVISKVDSTIPSDTRFAYAEWIVDESKGKAIPPLTIASLITQESRFNHKAISPVNAKGLGQFMKLTAQDVCEHLRISYEVGMEFNPRMNIKFTVWYLNRLYNNYGNISQALAYYNGGGKNAYRYKLYTQQKAGVELNADELVALGKLANETKEYVGRVLTHKKRFTIMLNKP